MTDYELHTGNADILATVRHRLAQADRDFTDRRHPFTTVTYAQSLDGCIAGTGGETIRLSNRQSQTLTHQLRAIHDAILVGINTVIRDNPRLNIRLVDGEDPQPVVVDTRLRFPLDANLLRDPCVRPIIVASHEACVERERHLRDLGARIVRFREAADGMLDQSEVFAFLKCEGFRSLMVEGGASIISSVLASQLADQYLLTITPRIVAGMHAVKKQPSANGNALPQLQNVQYQWLAGDMILRGDLEPTRNHIVGQHDRTTDETKTASVTNKAASSHRRNGRKEAH